MCSYCGCDSITVIGRFMNEHVEIVNACEAAEFAGHVLADQRAEALRVARSCLFEATTASTTKTSTPIQMSTKPAQREAGIGSSKTSQPRRNCPIGARYCRIAIVIMLTRRAAAANRSSGTAVTMPVVTSSPA